MAGGMDMQVQNPMYKFYKKLGGTWKSADGYCVAVIGKGTSSIKISYCGAELERGYSVYETGILQMGTAPMFVGGMMGQLYQRHDGEELMLDLRGAILSADGKGLFRIEALWYGNEELHLELTELCNGQRSGMPLTRCEDGTKPGVLPDGGFLCVCGNRFTSRFCPECGMLRPEPKTYSCACGYTGVVGKFCPNCGKKIEE